MDLRAWRMDVARLTLDQAGRMLGLSGPNVARSFHRIELGESAADADLVVAIGRLTKGAVSADDLNAARLGWLRRNERARKFRVEPVP